MPYQYSTISAQDHCFVVPASLRETEGFSTRLKTGDRANSILVDVVGFVSIFVALSFPWFSAALMGFSISLIGFADRLIEVVLLSLVMLLVVRSRLNLLDHLSDAGLLAAASFIGSIALLLSENAEARDTDAFGALATVLSCAACGAVCRLIIGILVTEQTKLGFLRRRIAIYGATEESAHCLRHLVGDKSKVLVGLFDDRVNPDRMCDFGIEVKGGLEDLIALAVSHRLDEVIIALPTEGHNRALAIAERLSDYPVHLRSPASVARAILGHDERFRLSRVGNVELVVVATRPLEGWKLVLKVIQDRVGAALLLVLFSPIMLIIALSIKLDSTGPVFFRQRRHGLCGQTIKVWKFRTMTVLEDGDTILQARSNDTRITRIGRILRKSSLDELPQLFNVLFGDMSLVGPRPHALAHNDYYARLIRTYNGRHRLKPGITGWAQINGLRGEISEPSEMKKRVDHDHWYIKNCSIWLDLKILMLTPVFGFFNRNAY